MTVQAAIEIAQLENFWLAIDAYGLDVDPGYIDDVERYVFNRREPVNLIVRAALCDILDTDVDIPSHWSGRFRFPWLFRRRAIRRLLTPELKALIAFVQAAVPMDAYGAENYHRWLCRPGSSSGPLSFPRRGLG